jgi:hypothetical protein
MEIKTNPLGSKREAVLETEWFYAGDYQKFLEANHLTIQKAKAALPEFLRFDYFARRRATEEMLKGQAFGL